MKRYTRFITGRILIAMCLALTALASGEHGPGTSPATAARPAQGPPVCKNIQLLIEAQGSQGATGTIEVVYRIHNLWGSACMLYGYPGVQLLDRHFHSLPTTVVRGGSIVGAIPRRTVRLGARGNAYFTLVYSDVPVNGRPCQASAAYLMIWAPNDFLPVVTYAARGGGGIASCTGVINVSPVTAQPVYR